MDKEINFPKGIMFKKKRDKAPEFVKGGISIKLDEAIPYLMEKKKSGLEWLNLDLLLSRKNTLYLKENNYKPKEKTEEPEENDEYDSMYEAF